MTDVTNINAATTGSITNSTPSTAVQKTLAETPSVSVSVSANSATTSEQSSRFVSNPLARVLVTQYYGLDGQVAAQVPSSTVVAYLENGLTADGTPRNSSIA